MQPPNGYPQQPQGQPYPQGPQPMPQGYGPPPGPMPPYAMQNQAYYQQPKRGMPGWAWALIIVAILLFCGFPMLGFLMMAAVGGGNSREAERAEGEQLMGSSRDFFRIQYSKTGFVKDAIAEFNRAQMRGDFSGFYYDVDPNPAGAEGSPKVEVSCSPTTMATDSYTRGHMEFELASGKWTTRWDDGVTSSSSSRSSGGK